MGLRRINFELFGHHIWSIELDSVRYESDVEPLTFTNTAGQFERDLDPLDPSGEESWDEYEEEDDCTHFGFHP